MADVDFRDFRLEVKAELDDTTIAWLHTWSHEIASQAKRNCQMDGDIGKQLRGSYDANVDESKGEGQIGTPLEAGYWEEFGTGEYAAKGNGRKGWWIYIPGAPSGSGGATYATKEEAEKMAAYIRAKYGKAAIVTNGRRPAYTLENSFKSVQPRAISDLEEQLGRRLGE